MNRNEHRKQNPSERSAFEALESRQLMSLGLVAAINPEDLPLVTPVVTSGTKTPLVINGSMGSDHIRLDARDGTISLSRENVIVSSHVAADISSIDVALRGGDDSITFSGTWNSPMPINVSGGSGNDTIKFQYAFGPAFKAGQSIVARGGSGNDLIEGTLLVERFYGEAGNDTLHGGPNDKFHDDIVEGGDGEDDMAAFGIVKGGAGDDTIHGGGQLFGEDGNDTLVGNVLSDVLFGGAGDDNLSGASGDDTLSGGAGNDSLSGGAGADVLTGSDGNDTLVGGADFDTMFGGGGDDLIRAANDGSRDYVYGGSGRDTAEVDNRGSSIFFWEVQDAWTEIEVVKKF